MIRAGSEARLLCISQSAPLGPQTLSILSAATPTGHLCARVILCACVPACLPACMSVCVYKATSCSLDIQKACSFLMAPSYFPWRHLQSKRCTKGNYNETHSERYQRFVCCICMCVCHLRITYFGTLTENKMLQVTAILKETLQLILYATVDLLCHVISGWLSM